MAFVRLSRVTLRIADFTGFYRLLASGAIAHAATVIEVETRLFGCLKDAFVGTIEIDGGIAFSELNFSH
jgi:hypothetical protein